MKLGRQWVEAIEIQNSKQARFICKMIPACCPFEQDIQIFGQELHIPALCKLNPFYNQLVELRFRALSYLVDERGEDITLYC